MKKKYEEVFDVIRAKPRAWLITGVGGFIGSNLLEKLLKLDQIVVGIDNFVTGYQQNLSDVKENVKDYQWRNFEFFEGDIVRFDDCRKACKSVDFVLHQAALGSVSRSIDNPIATNENNITGFLNMLVAAKETNVVRFVYAASSSSYGDQPDLPKIEEKIGKPLSPYAVSKLVNELYADVFSRVFEYKTIGLRYFNVFGERQDPEGAYAAVIPAWISAMLNNEKVYINGDGETSRDFCYIHNAVQANILAAFIESEKATNQVYNVAVGERISLTNLFVCMKQKLQEFGVPYNYDPVYVDFRPGDIRHSLADISKAQKLLGYEPEFKVEDGLHKTVEWFVNKPRTLGK